MTKREQIEAEIWELLMAETRPAVLSNKLFDPGIGLFAALATTEEERQGLVKAELYRVAQARVRELEHREEEAFRESHHVAQERLPETDLRLELEFPTLDLSPTPA